MKEETNSNYITRDQIPEEFKWNLSDLFANNDAWSKEKEKIKKEIFQMENFKGTLADSADNLYLCLDTYFSLKKEVNRLAVYAYQLADSDAKQTLPSVMRQEADILSTDLSTISSYISPEIISLSDELISTFLAEKEELGEYTHCIEDIRRFKNHVRSSSEEEIISQVELIGNIPSEINEIFRDVNMPRPLVKFGDKEVILSDANFSLYRSSSNREWRRLAFEKQFTVFKEQENFFGLQFSGYLRSNLFYKKVRNYSSCLEKSLHVHNIPSEVYHKLISATHDNLPTLHRYLKLRQRILGLEELKYYDLHTPLVSEFNKEYSFSEARELIEKSLIVLGDDYLNNIKTAFDNRWIDIYHSENKRSGAYSNGSAYDVHPYILMNYMGKYNDVTTLTHELGHSMHSYYSNKNQSYANSDYSIFLAEIASTCNEALLSHNMLQEISDPLERLSLLGSELEHYRTTLFRQTKFAEFEMKVHELAESGKSLSGEDLANIYLELLRKYYGHYEGVMNIDELYGSEWAYVPHFYYNFYVFQYATSLCASNMISKKIIDGEKDFSQNYINNFLSAGCSRYSTDILQDLGVDMSLDEPYNLAFLKMNEIMDEIEKILDKKS